MTRRILFVAMQGSPHTARWIDLIADEGWDLHLFPFNNSPVLPQMRGVTVHQPWRIARPRTAVRNLLKHAFGRSDDIATKDLSFANAYSERPIFPIPLVSRVAYALSTIGSIRLGESEARAPIPYGPHVLSLLIRRLKPDLIHSMEFQHCGYNVLRAKELAKARPFPKWLATNWGSDIYYFQRFPEHRSQISRLLRNIDYYSCECERDVSLAQNLGMTARVMPVMANTGGFDIASTTALRSVVRTSHRRVIMVKGYQHFAGRALTALRAVARCADVLRGYRIVIYSPAPELRDEIEDLRIIHGLDIHTLDYVSHDRMLKLFAAARVYLGVSISDAISTSLLEAMAMGAFPIQTNTACCDEWIEDGKTGFSVAPDDVEHIAARLRIALEDDVLVDNAAEMNGVTVRDRLDKRMLKQRAISLYEQIFSDSRDSQ